MNFIGAARPSEVGGVQIRYVRDEAGAVSGGFARIEGGKMRGRADRNVELLPVALAWMATAGWPQQCKPLTVRARREICAAAGSVPRASPEPDFAERVRVMRLHFDRYCAFYGETHGARLFRKVAPWYAKRFGPAKPFKQDIITINSRADFETVLERYIGWRTQFCDERSELLPRTHGNPCAHRPRRCLVREPTTLPPTSPSLHPKKPRSAVSH